jgi:hypothetical protein
MWRLHDPPASSNFLAPSAFRILIYFRIETKLSYVAATPKPRLVKLSITPQGDETFSVAGAHHKATRFRVKVEIGGIAGMFAPLVGKQPADTDVWVAGGEAPAFVKSEGPLYQGGPIWSIEMTSPVWHRARHADR